MKVLVYENAVVQIWFNEVAEYVYIKTITPSSSVEYRDYIRRYIEIIEEKNVKSTIADLQNIGALSLHDLKWTNYFLHPRKEKLRISKTAIIIGNDVFSNLTADEIYSKDIVRNTIEHYFTSLDDAEKWLGEK